MSVIVGKLTVTISDDPRYSTGGTYDVILQGAVAPDPASLVQGSLDAPPAAPDPTPPPVVDVSSSAPVS